MALAGRKQAVGNGIEPLKVWVGLQTGASLVAQMVKSSACNAGDPGSIPGWGRFPGEGNSNPLKYSCLENSMDGGTL